MFFIVNGQVSCIHFLCPLVTPLVDIPPPSYTDHVYTYRSSPLLPDISYPLDPLFPVFPSFRLSTSSILPVCRPTVCFIPTHWSISQILYLYMTIAVTCALFAPHRLSVCLLRLFFQTPRSLAAIHLRLVRLAPSLRPLCLVLEPLPEVPMIRAPTYSFLLNYRTCHILDSL